MTTEVDIAAALAASLRETGGLISAYLFGSVAEQRTHRESDIDVAVLLDWNQYPTSRARFDARLRLIGRLEGVGRRRVDLVILNDAPPQFARHIMTAGRRLLLVDADRDRAQLRSTLSRAADLEPFLRRSRATKLRALAR
ncbi:MAG: nucleotidyltransferase domain-containing protein [Vicinamibacterales bacterium]